MNGVRRIGANGYARMCYRLYGIVKISSLNLLLTCYMDSNSLPQSPLTAPSNVSEKQSIS